MIINGLSFLTVVYADPLSAELLQNLVSDVHCLGQNPLRQFTRSKTVTSCRGQKSVASVVSCRFPNSIITTCCQYVGIFPVYVEVTGKRVNWILAFKLLKQLNDIALLNKSSQSYGASLAIWDHTVLPAPP